MSTLLFHKSDIDILLKKEKKDKINLFVQFFISTNKERNEELKQSLFYNVSNPNINNIYLLNEKIYTNKELGIEKCEEKVKVKQINVKKRLSFKLLFDTIKNEKIKGYIIFANTDIFFDYTINNLKKSSISKTKGIHCLVRYEFTHPTLKKCKLFGRGRADSQDVWILHSKYIPNKTKIFNFNFGVPGCDNKLVYLFLILGYKVYNDPLFIKCYHNHKSQERNYDSFVNYPHSYLIPNMPTTSHISRLSKNTHKLNKLKNIEYEVDNFNKMSFNDNQLLINYLNKKISSNENFVIPRIAGVENNVVHITYMLNNKLENILYDMTLGKIPPISDEKRKKLDHELHFSGIKNYLNAMKNNAGIKITGSNGLSKYCMDYLKAFDNCEMFLGWAKWGNVYQYIIDSHNFMAKKYKQKDMVLALSMDIFHYIHNPWTHALKGKRLLIISPFIDSIREKEHIRKKIYGVDLFPNCTFVYLKPPQTQGTIESDEYYNELSKFYNKISIVKDDFDIALCSCGGYGNLVANYIYEIGKSAIYVGGVLQMYFGIYGNRWLRERKEVMQLYLNNHWTRPKELEKPKGFENVEKSAYW